MLPRENTFEEQEGKLGRKFRISAIHKGKKSVWQDGITKHDWYFIYKYLDDGSLFAIHKDIGGVFLEKLNHQQTLDFLCNLGNISDK